MASFITQSMHPTTSRPFKTLQAATLADKRIVVTIDGWEADSLYPSGHYVRTLGAIGDRETETEVGWFGQCCCCCCLLCRRLAPFRRKCVALKVEARRWALRRSSACAGRVANSNPHFTICISTTEATILPPVCHPSSGAAD